MSSLTLKANAKINLYLDIKSKRQDGYHNIQTVFRRLDLADRLTISKAKRSITINCRHPEIPIGYANLAYKAAKLIIQAYRLKTGLQIKISKKIPVAAGLGGGSSDAAAVMTAINRLFDIGIPKKRMMLLAAKIGADVPFFVSGYDCALGSGIGDRLKEIKDPAKSHVLLLVPNIKIYTKTIYKTVSLPLTKAPRSVNIIARFLTGQRSRSKDLALYNRLEDIVLPLYPVVKKARKAMSRHTKNVLVSGSGPTVFGLFHNRKEANKAKSKLKDNSRWRLFLTTTT
jgi:4-diphosphocytidyl-2-C-methyl-D-erythritol kinase